MVRGANERCPLFPPHQETQRLLAEPVQGISAIPDDGNARYFKVVVAGPEDVSQGGGEGEEGGGGGEGEEGRGRRGGGGGEGGGRVGS